MVELLHPRLAGWFHGAMASDPTPLASSSTRPSPVSSLPLHGDRRRPIKIVEHPTFRGHPKHVHPHAGFPPALLALPVRVVSLNDPAPTIAREAR